MMMAAGPEAAKRIKGKLRAVTSGGEPLNPEVIRWFREHLDVAVGDHYGQTEGAMMVCNHHGLSHPVKIGAAGLAMPGIRMAILDDKDRELPRGKAGILAVDRARSPLFWFKGYFKQDPASGAYHRTGDSAVMDEEGYVTFVGRADDVITSAGYRIGPYEVESALIEHPAVAESGVIGKPDPERTEIVKAFVVLRPGHSPSNALASELSQFVKTRLSAHSFPREIEFVSELPKTPSGKVQRYVLRERETGARGASA
jgi:acetyl-CoA synthetase